MKKKLTPYQRIVRAADANRGVRISAEEARKMAGDSAIAELAMNDDEDDLKAALKAAGEETQ